MWTKNKNEGLLYLVKTFVYWCVILILESPLSRGHFSCVEMFKLQIVVEHSALNPGLELQAKVRAWYLSIYLNTWKEWVQEAPQNQFQNARLLNAHQPLDTWTTQAQANWRMQKETGFPATEDSQVSAYLLPRSPSLEHPPILLSRSTDIFALCPCSEPLHMLFLLPFWILPPNNYIAAHSLPSFKSLLNEAIHYRLLYDHNPTDPTPSSLPQFPLVPFLRSILLQSSGPHWMYSVFHFIFPSLLYQIGSSIEAGICICCSLIEPLACRTRPNI